MHCVVAGVVSISEEPAKFTIKTEEGGSSGRNPSRWTPVRLAFVKLNMKGEWTWPSIYYAYNKKHPDDKKASADTIRLTYKRKRKKPTNPTK